MMMIIMMMIFFSFQDDPDIASMCKLQFAYEARDLHQIDRLLKGAEGDDSCNILPDTFMRIFIEELLENIRLESLKTAIMSAKGKTILNSELEKVKTVSCASFNHSRLSMLIKAHCGDFC
jgi:hypothetical protein